MLMDQPRSFDSQVLQIYATRGSLQQLSDSYRTRLMDDQVESLVAFTTRYLLQRPRPALDPSRNFAYLANYVVNELVKYDNIGDPESCEKLRYEYMHAFCRWNIKPWRILPSC